MTMAAGYIGMNGIVLCADTQETTDYTKTNTEKISHFGELGLDVAITGAGDSELIEIVGGRIQDALFRDYSPKTFRMPGKMLDLIQRELSSSFKMYIQPYAAFPSNERPYCDLLILVSVDNPLNNYECLFRATGTTVREISYGGACVGSGMILGQSLLERLCNSFMELDELVIALCYIMLRVKKGVPGCGGNTDLIFSSRKSKLFGAIASYDIEALERQLDSGENAVDQILTGLVNPNCDDDEFERRISNAREVRNRAMTSLFGVGSNLRETLGLLIVPRIGSTTALPSEE